MLIKKAYGRESFSPLSLQLSCFFMQSLSFFSSSWWAWKLLKMGFSYSGSLNQTMDHQINSGGPSWIGAKLLQQCLTLGQLCSWSTSTYALTTTELHTLPLLLPCSKSKWWDQPSASKSQHHPIHFVRTVPSHRIQPCYCQSVTSNHLAKENIILCCSGFSK